jgi:hypothetical protein
MPLPSGRTALLLPAILALTLGGCTNPAVEGKSPLSAVQMSPDSCVLEVCFVRFPFGDPEANQQLWQEVDEQQFPAELRRRLSRNGFRLGLLDGQIPAALARLLEMKDEARPTGGTSQIDLAALDSEPPVKRHLEIRAGQPKMIVTSGVYEQLPVLISESGELGGETYSQAQAVLVVKTFPQGDGRVRVELLPELQYGEVRQRWVGQDAMWRLEAGRQRRVFEDMAFSATLSPGCMLLLSSLPDRPGSLGHHFFSEDNGNPQQKLLVLRLAQTQHEGLFSPRRPLDLGQ